MNRTMLEIASDPPEARGEAWNISSSSQKSARTQTAKVGRWAVGIHPHDFHQLSLLS